MARCEFRWGVREWDEGHTEIPNPVLKSYSIVPWVDDKGKKGAGISNQEMMFIIHLASFKFESKWSKDPYPSVNTLKKRMGYAERKSITALRKSLEKKGLLSVIERGGWTNVYDFTSFSYAVLSVESEQPGYPNTHPPGYPNTRE